MLSEDQWVFPIQAEIMLIVTCPWLSLLLPTVYYLHVINLFLRRQQERHGAEKTPSWGYQRWQLWEGKEGREAQS